MQRALEIGQVEGIPTADAWYRAREDVKRQQSSETGMTPSDPADLDDLLADPARWPHHVDAWCSVHAWLAYRPPEDVEAVLTGKGIETIDLHLPVRLSPTTAMADVPYSDQMFPQVSTYFHASIARVGRMLELKSRIEAQGYSDFQPVEAATHELRAFCVRRKDLLLIAFRGTVTCRNWRDDFRCWPAREGPRRHRGFVGCWQALGPQIIDWVRAQAPATPRLVLTGHSLGGALAVLAAFDLMRAGIDGLRIEAVSLFGCPRVGLDDFARDFHATPARPGEGVPTLGQVTRRNISGADLVARVPPPSLTGTWAPVTGWTTKASVRARVALPSRGSARSCDAPRQRSGRDQTQDRRRSAGFVPSSGRAIPWKR